MSGTFKMVTVIGTSPGSVEDAIQDAIRDAARTVRNLSWFEVKEMRGRIDGNAVVEHQVKLEVGFKVDTD